MTQKATASGRKQTETPASELMAAQANSRKELGYTGIDLAITRQQRDRRAKAIRGHFRVLEGGRV